MSEDTGSILLIVLLGGVAVWWLLNRKQTVTAPPPAPCVVSGSYQGTGLSVPCSLIDKGVKEALKVADAVATTAGKDAAAAPGAVERTVALPFHALGIGNGNGYPKGETPLKAIADVNVRSLNSQHKMVGGAPLPAGATNVAVQVADGNWVVQTILQPQVPGAPPVLIGSSNMGVKAAPSAPPPATASQTAKVALIYSKL